MNLNKVQSLNRFKYSKNGYGSSEEEGVNSGLDHVHISGDGVGGHAVNLDSSVEESPGQSKSGRMVSLLKLPPLVSSVDRKSFDEKVWYLQELAPNAEPLYLEKILRESQSLDEAERRLLLERDDSKPRDGKKIHKRVRILSDSSNEDSVISPLKPVQKKTRNDVLDSTLESDEAVIDVPVESPPNSKLSSGTRVALTSTQRNILSAHAIKVVYPGVQPIRSLQTQATLGRTVTAATMKNDDDDSSSVASDDDEEIAHSRTKREIMLKFFNEATFEDMVRMPRCSNKKSDLIISLRPYTSWKDLVSKFSSKRQLSLELLAGCKELIEIRQVVLDLMERCEKMAQQMSSLVNKLIETDNLGSCQIKDQPTLLTSSLTLKPYQMIGLNWLLLMYQQHVDGILADEMGLGKTAQSIAFLAYLLEQGNPGPHLIIVPSSTLDNWMSEINRWCPSLKVVSYHGKQEERLYKRQQILNEPDTYNIVLSTYNVLTSTAEDKQIYKKLIFQYAIFDEAHMLKNMATARYKNLMKISAKRRLLLTGTPFQNDLVELMSLLCFVMPDMFINKEDQLKRMFITITTKGKEGSTSYELERIEHAKSIMKPFVLRRLKKDVLKDLPTKTSSVEYVEMTAQQRERYAALANRFASEGVTTLAAFTELRFAANHPLLLRWRYTDSRLKQMASLMLEEPTHREANKQFIFEDMQVMNDFELNNLCQQYKILQPFALNDEEVLNSGKFRYLDSILPSYKGKGEKVVIFTQFQLVLHILEVYMKRRGHTYCRLDGSTPVEERLDMIEEYNRNPAIFVFILSTRAGGLGINLTAANNVIIHDIDFNPHNDRQAEDRCHRVGQERNVTVTRLITKGTAEDAMLQTANRKLQLEKHIQESKEGNIQESKEDVASLIKEALTLWSSSN